MFSRYKSIVAYKDITAKTHSGVVNQLHRHFVLSGRFDQSHAAFFSRIMQERIDDDYSDFMIVDENEVREYIEPAKAYVAYIIALVEFNAIDHSSQ